MKVCMIIDDSSVIRKVTRRIVEDMDYVVDEAENAENGLRKCDDSMPDVILVDWKTAAMSGVEFIQQLGKRELASATKVIFCTSELLVAEMTKAKRAGAHGFLMKPFNRKLLQDKFIELGLYHEYPDKVAYINSA